MSGCFRWSARATKQLTQLPALVGVLFAKMYRFLLILAQRSGASAGHRWELCVVAAAGYAVCSGPGRAQLH